MRDLLLIFDSMRYDIFKNLLYEKTFDLGRVYKAYTHGSWTRPSVCSMLSGYLPTSDYGQPYKPSWVMLSPQVFHDREVPSWFINGNAWMSDMAPRRYTEKKFFDPHSAPQMVDETISIMKHNKEFFIAMLFVETHGPYNYIPQVNGEKLGEKIKAYNQGKDNNAPQLARVYQARGINYLLGLTRPLMKLSSRTYLTSDHGDLMGEHHKIGHDPSYPFHVKLVEVPLAVI